MDRLTEYVKGKYIRIKGTKSLYLAQERKGAPASNAIVRLAAYEDAGFAQKLSSWTSVLDKLPEKNEDVIMYFNSGNMAAGFWDGENGEENWHAYTDDGWFTGCDCYPVYWMPLPAPPEED